eukprot:COSAG01_NODE_8826_length_2647_cov_5.760379_1_plen_84_part_00
MWDTPNDHSRGHFRTLVRTTILVVAYLTTIPNLMPNRMSLLRHPHILTPHAPGSERRPSAFSASQAAAAASSAWADHEAARAA